jgi:hypothetical protein
MIRVIEVPLPKDKLQQAPKEERSLFLLLGYAANQITMLQKMMIFSSNKDPSHPAEQRISAAQTQMCLRLLIGAVHEGWLLVQRRFLGSPIGKDYQGRLNASGLAALDQLKRYFGSSNNIVSVLRNNFAYHHPLDADADAAFQEAVSDNDFDDYWKLYFSETSINSFHFAGDIVIVNGMKAAIGELDLLAAQERIVKDVSNVAHNITEFILDFSAAFLVKNTCNDPSNPEILGKECDPIADAPPLLEFWLPFFVEP